MAKKPVPKTDVDMVAGDGEPADTAVSTVLKVLAPAAAQGAMAVPDFMERAGTDGTEDLGGFVTPPRLKVVQRNANPPYSDLFDGGDVVLTPQMLTVAPVKRNESGRPGDEGTPFAFIPLLFFPEWLTINPLCYKGSEDFIRARSLDPKSDIAIKAKSPDTWSEIHPERPEHDGKEVFIRHVECLNYTVVLVGIPGLEGLPIVMSFSKTGHRTGSNLAALIRMRRAPLYGCIFEAKVVTNSNTQNSWYNLSVSNPDVTGLPAFVQDADEFAQLKEVHEGLKDRVSVDYSDLAEGEPSTASVDSDKF